MGSYEEEKHLALLVEHIEGIFENQLHLNYNKLDWTKKYYKNPSLNSAVMIYELLKSLVLQIQQQESLPVSTAQMFIPLTKHCNKCRNETLNSIGSSDHSIIQTNESRIKELETEISISRELIDTLEQYKQMYFDCKQELEAALKSGVEGKVIKRANEGTDEQKESYFTQEMLHLGKSELHQNITPVYEAINSLLERVNSGQSSGAYTEAGLKNEFLELRSKLEQFEQIFSQQVPMIKILSDKISNSSNEQLLKKLSYLDEKTNKIKILLEANELEVKTLQTPVENEPALVLHQGELQPIERYVEFLEKQVEEYKDCIVTLESEVSELFTENNSLKKQQVTLKSQPYNTKKYIEEIQNCEQTITSLKLKNVQLEHLLAQARLGHADKNS